MTERHELRWGGLAGLGFIALAAIAVFLPGIPPRVDSTAGEVSAYFTDSRGEILVAALLWSAAAALVIWFASAVAGAVREREGRRDLHLAQIAGAVRVGGAMFINAALLGATAYGVGERAADMTYMHFELASILTTTIGFASALPLTAAGLGVLRTHLMPDWLGYLGFVAAAVSVVGAFGIFATDGRFVAGGPLMTLVPLAVSALFVLCGSVYMVREQVPEVTATRPAAQAS
jgi:hypothetical protein